MISREVADEFAALVGKALRERYGDKLIFAPIVVEPSLDHYDDEYLDAIIVFTGDQKNLDPRWSNLLPLLLAPELDRLGVPGIPGISYVEKSEWEEVFHGKHPRAHEPYGPN